MKVMVISDIHGSLARLEQAMIRYKEEKAEKLFILGDFLNRRNFLYNNSIAEILNEMAEDITAVRGNNDDFELDELMDFKVQDIANAKVNGKKITMTHGHLFHKNRLPENCGEIFLQGHTHVGQILKIDDKMIANPGSIFKPRNGTEASYLILDEKGIELKNLDGEVLQKILFT